MSGLTQTLRRKHRQKPASPFRTSKRIGLFSQVSSEGFRGNTLLAGLHRQRSGPALGPMPREHGLFEELAKPVPFAGAQRPKFSGNFGAWALRPGKAEKKHLRRLPVSREAPTATAPGRLTFSGPVIRSAPT